MSSSFAIELDPRLTEAGVSQEDLVAQEELSLKIRDLLSDARKMEDDLAKEKKSYEKKIKDEKEVDASKEAIDKIDEVKNKLTTAKGRYQIPQLVDQLGYLYSMLLRADQAPGKDAFDRYEELKERFDSLKEMEWPKTMGEED